MLRVALIALGGLLLITLVNSETVQYELCESVGPQNCTINEVRINPCAEASSNKPCKIKRGKSAQIEFDFTPGVSSESLKSKAYWANSVGDLGLAGMDTNACSFAQCPAVAGTQNSYSFTLRMSRMYPVRGYDFKWKLWNEEQTMECCFLAKVKLVR